MGTLKKFSRPFNGKNGIGWLSRSTNPQRSACFQGDACSWQQSTTRVQPTKPPRGNASYAGSPPGGSKPASGDTISSSAPAEGVDDPTADNFTAESASAEEVPAEPEATPEPTPEPTPVPEYEGLSVQPTTYYNEGEQPTYTVTDGNNLNMRGGPGTDYDKIGQVPASTGVTALGANEDGSWVVVNYNGTYGWLKTEFLNG